MFFDKVKINCNDGDVISVLVLLITAHDTMLNFNLLYERVGRELSHGVHFLSFSLFSFLFGL